MSRKQVGVVSVDSGGIVIVDPRYLLGSDIEDGGKRNYAFWGRDEEQVKEIIEKNFDGYLIEERLSSYYIRNISAENIERIEELTESLLFVGYVDNGSFGDRAFNARNSESLAGEFFAKGFGTAVASSSGYGDGVYPVYATYNDEGRIAKLEIEFIEEDKERVKL